MNDDERATLLRRLAAFAIDTVVVTMLTGAYFLVWVSVELGGLPQTPAEFAIAIETAPIVMPTFFGEALIAYAVLAMTPILGRRTVGMRQLGTMVVRDRRRGA